jgi:hypothetical protein
MRLWMTIAGLAFLAAPANADTNELIVGFEDVVKPDANLQAFVGHVRSLNVSSRNLDYRAIDALFAPRVKTFRKSLDPFQPWSKSAVIRSDYLKGAADIMVEQGELEEGAPVPDYRPDAMKMIVEQLSRGEPFGTIKEMPGAVCTPAVYTVDRKAALAFAGKYRLDAYSLRFYSTGAMLLARPRSPAVTAHVPPYALMMFDHDPTAPEGWGRYETSDGIKGYMPDRDDTLGLAQHHVCFGKIKGKYRITALFGYGL